MKIFTFTSFTALLLGFLPMANPALAQSLDTERPESSTAILDTSIPFAIGAREGDQTIRGSFGWPTFQEGFVEGVYFRFDPDGYARFSSSPRLDEDVFEVICQNATTVCVARKNGLEIALTGQGKPQIRISGTTAQDRYFISDRKSELPLPNAILGPIEQRLEALLSSGGDLIIRRELETLQTLSLSGFSATVTYLRWVAQNQASFVFPRGWPAPSQQTGQKTVGLTLQDSWNAPNADTQSAPATWGLQTPQDGLEQTQNGWPAQSERRSSGGLKSDAYELSAIGFAQQAQARSLPADVNKFEVPSSQANSPQVNVQYEGAVDQGNLGATSAIELELSRIRHSLRNLEVQMGNLANQISYEIRSVNTGSVAPGSSSAIPYQGIGDSAKATLSSLSAEDAQLSEEEKLRKLVIESLLQQAQQKPINTQNEQPLDKSGEVSVKKNIVERLLEELNGTSEANEAVAAATATGPSEFISLSEYISRVMQEEKPN